MPDGSTARDSLPVIPAERSAVKRSTATALAACVVLILALRARAFATDGGAARPISAPLAANELERVARLGGTCALDTSTLQAAGTLFGAAAARMVSELRTSNADRDLALAAARRIGAGLCRAQSGGLLGARAVSAVQTAAFRLCPGLWPFC